MIYFQGPWPAGQVSPPDGIWVQYQAFLGAICTGKPPVPDAPAEITVAEVCAKVLREVQAEGSRNEFLNLRAVVRLLLNYCGTDPASALDARKFLDFRAYLLRTPITTTRKEKTRVKIAGKTQIKTHVVTTERPRSRRGANKTMKRVRHIWALAVSYGLLPAGSLEGLKAAIGNRKKKADDDPQILPVSDADVQATLPHLPRIIAAMVRLQRITAMRPGELVMISMGEIDRSDRACWWYHPARHKNQWRGHRRSIPLGPQAQEILRPFLRADPDRPLFSPADRIAEFRAAQRAQRKTPVQPSQQDRSKAAPARGPGQAYTTQSYGRAIKAACKKAGVPAWSANQLRKAAADEILNSCDLEHAAALLGHSHPDITARVYAVRDRAKASVAAARIVGV